MVIGLAWWSVLLTVTGAAMMGGLVSDKSNHQQVRFRAGLIGASLGVAVSALGQAASPLDVLTHLWLWWGHALCVAAFSHLADPLMPPPLAWTDAAILAIAVPPIPWRGWVFAVGGAVCLTLAGVTGRQALSESRHSLTSVALAASPRPVQAGAMPQLESGVTQAGASAPTVMPTPSVRGETAFAPLPTLTPSPVPTVFQRLPILAFALASPGTPTPPLTAPEAILWPPPLERAVTAAPVLSPSGAHYPFGLQSEPLYLANFANTRGCDWSGLGGQVLDLTGQPAPGYRVRLWTGTNAQTVTTGDFPAYGPAGYEFTLGDHPRETAGEYAIELLAADGHTPLSPRYPLATRASCRGNFALLIFVEAP